MRILHRSLAPSTLARLACLLAASAGPGALAQQGHTTSTAGSTFQGTAALQLTHRATNFGERPSGSPAIQRLRDWIVTECKSTGGEVTLDAFTGETPAGPVP